MTATTQNENNAAQNNEGNAAMNEVNGQAGKSEVLKNTSVAEMIAVTDQIFADYKGDSQELQLIVAMHKVNDDLSLENITHILKGDKAIYTPKPRKNAAKGKIVAPTSANQRKGALLNLLPHYAALDAQADKDIVSFAGEVKKAEKEKVAQLSRNLTDKQILALHKATREVTNAKNAGKSEAMLKVAALDEMFERAIKKLYYLRRVSANDVRFNAKSKTITFTGFGFEVDSGKAKMYSEQGEYTVTLAELSRDSNSWLKSDDITSTQARATANTRPTDATATSPAPSVAINPLENAAKNSKELSNLYKALRNDKVKTAEFRKAENAKELFTQYFMTMFIVDGTVDMDAFQKAVDVAMAKAKIARKVAVVYGTDLQPDSKAAKAQAVKANVKRSAKAA
jgi:transcriptional regulator of met regulon